VGLALEKLGFTRVYVLLGGWPAWVAQGYPTAPKEID
jgi:rhodanese-related sulfurtransferase